MSSLSPAYFDRLAGSYDQTWTNAPVGRLQRSAVWRELDPLIHSGTRVLDLGCGTGEDALHFQRLGAEADAIDGSPKMAEAARRKGVPARFLLIEEAARLQGSYDLVLSNFGALNCVKDLPALRAPLAALTRPGGVLAICVLHRFCLWESCYFASRGQFQKARRRWGGEAETSSGLRVFYPSARTLRDAFAPDFRVTRDLGIGVVVPPSYVSNLSPALLHCFAACDARIAATPAGRAIADHRLFLFTRSR